MSLSSEISTGLTEASFRWHHISVPPSSQFCFLPNSQVSYVLTYHFLSKWKEKFKNKKLSFSVFPEQVKSDLVHENQNDEGEVEFDSVFLTSIINIKEERKGKKKN